VLPDVHVQEASCQQNQQDALLFPGRGKTARPQPVIPGDLLQKHRKRGMRIHHRVITLAEVLIYLERLLCGNGLLFIPERQI
jgi:hypothetical protein